MNSLKTRIVDKRFSKIFTQFQGFSSTISLKSSEIQIPMRKERGPTDILQALESTLKRDPTAPHYKYIDDPYCIPNSLKKKRVYALSKESGKKAAMWIMEEHGDLLQSNLSDPLIKAFLPHEKYENKSQVSEEILIQMIKQERINEVENVYNLLEGDVTKGTKQAMLELLCFFNSDLQQINIEFTEERSYQPNEEVTKNVWKKTPLIDKLFDELHKDESTASAAYSALISGLAKYYQIDRAWAVFNQCLERNVSLSVTTYNQIIKVIHVIKDNDKDRQVLLKSVLEGIAQNGVKPTIQTLNACLKTVSMFTSQELAKKYALTLLSEFSSIGIKPSLGSYYYILLIYCRINGPTSHILIEILDNLEKQEQLEYQDAVDKHFFVCAMEIAFKHLHDINTGNRIHDLLLKSDNYILLGGRLFESVYYRNYLQLILSNKTIDEFMKFYSILVPNVYIPEPALMRDIFDILELNNKKKIEELMPTFLSQIVMFDMLDHHRIMNKAFQLMVSCSLPSESPLQKQFTEMALTALTHIEQFHQRKIERWLKPAQFYGNMAVLFFRGKEFEKMLQVLNILAYQNATIGSINKETLQELFIACIKNGYAEGAITALEYNTQFDLIDSNSMAKMIRETFSLSTLQEDKLITLVKPEK